MISMNSVLLPKISAKLLGFVKSESNSISSKKIPLYLAPMEGLADPLVREFWTELGGFSGCTTEFVRITNQLLPNHVFWRECPELLNGGRTSSGVPVAVQLLGGDPYCLAENAALAGSLGAPSVDLNFGCPAPTVNRHDGGAVLLNSPDRIFNILTAVRKAVPLEIPVTAKLRLGCMDESLLHENMLAAAGGGAASLVVHCRTKKDFYTPPAKWDRIPQIRETLNRHQHQIPIFANGEIWTERDFFRCQEVTSADGYVIGRGAIANPFLVLQIRQRLDQGKSQIFEWKDVEALLPIYFQRSLKSNSSNSSPNTLVKAPASYAVARIKQWLRFLTQTWPEAVPCFEKVKLMKSPQEILDYFLSPKVAPPLDSPRG